MERCATAMEASATSAAVTMTTSASAVTTTTSSAAAAVATTYFGGQRAGRCLRDRRSAGIDQRHRLSVLT